jgi:sulfur-oxidizing protein SoxY
MIERNRSDVPARRRLLRGATALVLARYLPAHAADKLLPQIPALSAFLATRTPRWERVSLELPQLADNGQVVPMRLSVAGPFAPGPFVGALHLYSEMNPVPQMAVFEFPVPLERIEVESRVRLAATQHVVALAEMTDGSICAAMTEVVVTLAGCLDGT